MSGVPLTLDLPGHLPDVDRARIAALAERNLADHGDGFLGLVLSTRPRPGSTLASPEMET